MKHYSIPPLHSHAEPASAAGPAAACLAAFAAFITACAAPHAEDRSITRGLDRADRYVQRTEIPSSPDDSPPRPLAILNDDPITLDDLRPALLEAAGPLALEEAALDRLLAREAAVKNLTIGRPALDAEESLVRDTFASAGVASSPDDAARLLASLRAARRLGDNRYTALLRRNATLRALVAPSVVITPALLDQARALRFGERYRARVIVVSSAAAAADLRAQLESGADFSILAAEHSIDATASRGGLLDPISPADPSYPAAIRSTLRSMKPGDLGDPIAVDQGFAILRLDRIDPATESASSIQPQDASRTTQPALERDVRAEQERLLMNQLTRRLLTEARLTILDPTLQQAWTQRPEPRP